MSTELTKFTIQEFAGFQIKQREDGYLNATEMCKVGKKDWFGYIRNKQTKEYLEELGRSPQICGDLIQSITTGPNENRGTWVHPRVAIHLAQWVSPKFAVQVTDWVMRFMSGDLSLVKEVVQRHDAINDVESKVTIDSVSRQLTLSQKRNVEYVRQISTFISLTSKLEDQIKKLTDETVRINNLKCPYCNKLYSSPIGLTAHIRRNCDDNNRRRFRAIVDADKFKIWAKFVVDDWKEISEEYEFTFSLALKDWDTLTPSIKSIPNKKKKNTVFNILRNEDRWQFLELINQKISVPLELLMEKNSLQMFNDNRNAFNIYIDAVEPNAELLKYQELHATLNPDE